jgi:arylamine N-acetyltransferase
LVIIVTLDDGSTYACDVSFGGDGPTQPLLLEDGYTISNIGSQEVQLKHDFVDEQTSRLPHQKLWIYQYRNGKDKPWLPFYIFGEYEFFPIDFEGLNFSVSQDPNSFQRFRILVIKFLKKEDETKICGKLMLVDGTLKVNKGGKTETLRVAQTEAERIEILEKYFDITLTQEQLDGIKGFQTELPLKEDFTNRKW